MPLPEDKWTSSTAPKPTTRAPMATPLPYPPSAVRPSAPAPVSAPVQQGRTNPMQPNVPEMQNDPAALQKAQQQLGSSGSGGGSRPPRNIGQYDAPMPPQYLGMNPQDQPGAPIDLRAVASRQGGSSMGYNPQQQQQQQGQQQAPINDSYQQQPPQGGSMQFPQQQGQQGQMGLGPNGQPMPAYGPSYTPPAAMQDEYQGVNARRGQSDGIGRPSMSDSYQQEAERLQKAAQRVASDPSFSEAQREQAFDKIRARGEEIKSGYDQGRELTQSTTGSFEPDEEFGVVDQPMREGDLEPQQDGTLRNTLTGDVLRTVRAPNGQVMPMNPRQYEIDSLPEGTSYMDAAGKIQVTKPADGSGRGSSGAGAGAGGGGKQLTNESALAAFDKWNKTAEVGKSPEEAGAFDNAIVNLSPDEQEEFKELFASDPASAIEELIRRKPESAQDLDAARESAFGRDYKAAQDRAGRLGKSLGVEQPEDAANAAKPPVNPDQYTLWQGNRGTAQFRRRGSELKGGIPAVEDANGVRRPGPKTVAQLADMEANTDFVNIQPGPRGTETRILPFGVPNGNTGDLVLNNAQRRVFNKEMTEIGARTPEAWNALEGKLQQFAVTGARWDPKAPKVGADGQPTPQARLEGLVHKEYSNLSPEGRAVMTMYIANALGYEVGSGPTGGFKSTGWATKTWNERKPAEAPAEAPRRATPAEDRAAAAASQVETDARWEKQRQHDARWPQVQADAAQYGGQVFETDVLTAEERPFYEMKKGLDEATASRKFGELSPDPGREYTERKAAEEKAQFERLRARQARDLEEFKPKDLPKAAAAVREAGKPVVDALSKGIDSAKESVSTGRKDFESAVDSTKKSIATGVKDLDRNLGRALNARSPEQIAEDKAIVESGKESEAKRQRDGAQAAIDSNKVSPAVKAQRAANEASRRSGSGQNRKKK